MNVAKKQSFVNKAKELLGVDGWTNLRKKFEDVNITETTEEETETEETMMEAILEDGSKIIYDKLAEGGKVMVVTPEGEIAIPDGEYLINDGSKLVTVGGLISKIEAAVAADNAPVAEEEMEVDESGKMMDEKCEALYQRIMEALKPKDETVKADEEMKSDFAAMRKDMAKLVEVINLLMEEEKTETEASTQRFGKDRKQDLRRQIIELEQKYSTKKVR